MGTTTAAETATALLRTSTVLAARTATVPTTTTASLSSGSATPTNETGSAPESPTRMIVKTSNIMTSVLATARPRRMSARPSTTSRELITPVNAKACWTSVHFYGEELNCF